jgi:hypothetical protein
MKRLKIIRNRRVLNGIFFIAGFILFATQLSGKFYVSANMPLLGATGHYSPARHQPANAHSVSEATKVSHLSLDKRYTLSTAFGLPAPVIRATGHKAIIEPFVALLDGNPLAGISSLTHLRGPPPSFHVIV